MSAHLIVQQTPDAAALIEQQERLAAVRVELAERETEFAQLQARLKVFDSRYLREVGTLYAELDELEALICEREVDLYDSESARRRAREARERARETHDAAASVDLEAEEFEPPPSLKTLFREVAKRIHPDFARDRAEEAHFTRLMMRANQAYSRGDGETLQRILDDQLETHAGTTDDGPGVELLRVLRQIQHAERDIAAIAAEADGLRGSEIGQLLQEAEEAELEGRDVLSELAAGLREQVADAQYRYDFVDRQIGNHGR